MVGIETSYYLKRVSFEAAIRFRRRFGARPAPGWLKPLVTALNRIAYLTVFRPILDKLGYNDLRLCIVGGAALPSEISGFWRDVGIDVILDQTDLSTQQAQRNAFGPETKDRLTFQTSNIIEMQAFRVHHFSRESPRGDGEFPELEEAIIQLRSTLDADEHIQLFRNVGDVAYPLHIVVPLFWVSDELMYNPQSGNDDMEFIELLNITDAPIDLTGWKFFLTDPSADPEKTFVVSLGGVG
jgi:hypothetical protein